jgi:hypothetical protein
MQLMQHARAREVEIGRCREIANHEVNLCSTRRAKPVQNGFQDSVATALGQGYPVAGGLSQSAVNDKAGARRDHRPFRTIAPEAGLEKSPAS